MFFVRPVMDEEIAVVRQKDGNVKAFYNVCMHRATPLLEGQGQKATIACPYHAWTYDLGGQLRAAPFSSDVPGFSCKAIRLNEVRVEVFHGLIFANLDDDAPSLASQAKVISSEIAELVPGFEDYHYVDEVALEHPCNWKVTVENYSECYHCRVVHGNDLFAKLDVKTYTLNQHGTTASHSCEPKVEYRKGDVDHPLKEDGSLLSWFIWPNCTINRQPGGSVRVGLFESLAIDRTIYRYRYFSNGTLPDMEVVAYMNRHAELIGAEDAELVKKVQRGLRSRSYTPGILIADSRAFGEREHGVHHFQSLVLDALDK